MIDMIILRTISRTLVIIGGVVWGLYGLFKFNLIEALLGDGLFSRLIYILVGVAAGYLIYLFFTSKSKAPPM